MSELKRIPDIVKCLPTCPDCWEPKSPQISHQHFSHARSWKTKNLGPTTQIIAKPI